MVNSQGLGDRASVGWQMSISQAYGGMEADLRSLLAVL